jgi:hypothetical protein
MMKTLKGLLSCLPSFVCSQDSSKYVILFVTANRLEVGSFHLMMENKFLTVTKLTNSLHKML